MIWRWLKNWWRGCQHKNTRGVANYYAREHRVYLQLTECLDCGTVLIEETRGG